MTQDTIQTLPSNRWRKIKRATIDFLVGGIVGSMGEVAGRIAGQHGIFEKLGYATIFPSFGYAAGRLAHPEDTIDEVGMDTLFFATGTVMGAYAMSYLRQGQ